MAVFSYRSATRDGLVREGVIEAADEKAALGKLKNTGLIPLEIRAPREEGLFSRIRAKTGRADLAAFTVELSTLLTAGLPLDRSLAILAEIAEHRGTRETVQSLLASIREGNSFSDALLKHPRTFPRIYVNMIRAGEAGGVLDAVLEKLNEFLESSKELKDHVVSAMIYPAILV